MKSVLDKLNLRPQERRLVVVVALVVFVVLNIWFVWPYFGEWSQVERKMTSSRDTLAKYQKEINRVPQYKTELTKLLESGSEMLASDLDLQRIVTSNAIASSLQITGSDARFRLGTSRTNQFFEEQALSIQFTSGGKELIDFLVGIASANAMIRVREMNIKPDNLNNPTRLVGNIVFVGNYQKQTNTTTSATPARRRT